MDPLLTPREAAEYLRIATRTLETWRYRKQGPAFVRLPTGGIRYKASDLEAYLVAAASE